MSAYETVIGKGRARVDGPLKVTGRAMYASDHHFPGTLYAVPVCSTIAHGTIESLDAAAAEKMPGVKAVFRRENIGQLFRIKVSFGDEMSMIDEQRMPFEDDIIRYYGQYVALAVAETFEQAKAAADAVKVRYQTEPHEVDEKLAPEKLDGVTKANAQESEDPTVPQVESERGDPEKAFAEAPVQLDATYSVPVETHNPIELHATLAVWEGDSVTLYDSTQAVVNTRNVLAQILGVPKENVRVISKFLGSGFGGKLWPWPHCALAAAAARQLGQPVKLVLSRKMMFQNVGHRPALQQRIRVSATPEGKLTSLRHEYVNHTSILDDYQENCGEGTPHLYSVPNLRVTAARARRHVGTPTSMRGPGAVPGLFATESAMDELAIKLKMDPVQFRLANEPEMDEGLKLPFSSRHLRECFTLGAEKFGWAAAHAGGRLDAERRRNRRMGHGGLHLDGEAARLPRARGVARRRHRAGLHRHAGYRHRHLHRAGAGREREAPAPGRENRSGARRYDAAARPALRRVDGDGLRHSGRARRGGQGREIDPRGGGQDAGLKAPRAETGGARALRRRGARPGRPAGGAVR